MHIDPMQEWQRLTEAYREKSDLELMELNRDFGDLTDVAKQVLSAELRSRGLDKKIAEQQQTPSQEASPFTARFVSPFTVRAEEAVQGRILGKNTTEPVPDSEDEDEAADGPDVEYTWKTVLCECEEQDQASQVFEVLKRAGIRSWIEPSLYTRILVAADELDRARAIVANPIPQDIIDESHENVPEYEPPRCPGCGAEDPTLESADPVNSWKCESCGREWSDPECESKPSSPFA